MIDTSGVSLSASDPNPSIDQFDDGGSSTDWQSLVQTAGQWGLEIAAIVNNRTPQTSSYVGPGGSPYGVAPYPGGAPPMSPTTKLLVIALLVGGGVWVLTSMGKA